jgi:hypothetical protein
LKNSSFAKTAFDPHASVDANAIKPKILDMIFSLSAVVKGPQLELGWPKYIEIQAAKWPERGENSQ